MELKDCFSTEDLKIGKDDIVNIATTQYEEGLENDIEEARLLLKTNLVALKEAKRAFELEAKEVLDDKTKENIKKVTDSIRKMGVTYVPAIRGINSESDKLLYFAVTFSVNEALRDIGTYTSQEFSIKGQVNMPKSLKKLRDSIKSIEENISIHEETVATKQDQLMNMDSFIRKSRSKLTRSLMERFSDGDDIVQALLESVQGTQKRLK